MPQPRMNDRERNHSLNIVDDRFRGLWNHMPANRNANVIRADPEMVCGYRVYDRTAARHRPPGVDECADLVSFTAGDPLNAIVVDAEARVDLLVRRGAFPIDADVDGLPV